VKPAPFDYHRPASVDEATQALAETGGKVLAGGQSLVPLMSMRLAAPTALVDINQVGGLDTVEVGDTAVRIGALVRHRRLERHDGVYAANPLLRKALVHVSHATVRNRGTTVGSLVHADPASEMPAVLRLLGGSVEVVSHARGRRTVAAADLFVGPLESSLAADELAVAATFPRPARDAGSAWVEVARRHGDYAMVGVGAVVVPDAEGAVAAADVVLIGVGPTPRPLDLSGLLAGRSVAMLVDGDPARFPDVADAVDAAVEPEADIHATAEYRRHLARVLTARALVSAARDAVDWSPSVPSDQEWLSPPADDAEEGTA
jgi:carbon-monoxide dehydrogenase medium subunit